MSDDVVGELLSAFFRLGTLQLRLGIITTEAMLTFGGRANQTIGALDKAMPSAISEGEIEAAAKAIEARLIAGHELGFQCLLPRDPETSIFLLFKGWAYFMMGQDNEALVWLRRAAAASPETPIILAALTSELALTGHDVEARTTLAQYLALKGTRTRTVAQWDHVPDHNAPFLEFHQRFRSGLRKAAMPER